MPYIVGPTNISQLSMDNGIVRSGIRTTTSTGSATLVSLDASTFTSVDYQVQVVKGSSFNSSLIKVIHDGSTAYMTEYGNVNQPDVGIATFSADISGGDIRLLGFPDSSDSTTFKVIFSAIKS
tara:strand:- start:447 stop:815 length:369 start_codon:yes stop_codon:yes gene_type:complete